MSKYVTTRIEEMREYAFKKIPAAIAEINSTATDDPAAVSSYLYNHRVVLNEMLVSTILGATFKEPSKAGKKVKVRYNKPIPNGEELSSMVNLISRFYHDIEMPFLTSRGYTENGTESQVNNEVENELFLGDDDTDDTQLAPAVAKLVDVALPIIEKVNPKKMKNALFGYEGSGSIVKDFIIGTDVVALYAMAEKLRKRRNLGIILAVAGGVTIASAAGIAIAIGCASGHDDEDNNVDDINNDPDALPDYSTDDDDEDVEVEVPIEDEPEVASAFDRLKRSAGV